VACLRIPPVLFFIGKHFGTGPSRSERVLPTVSDRRPGVILSTAFVHLLQDAFEALLHPDVKRMTRVGEWAGLLVYVPPLTKLVILAITHI
jgi:zinc transporter 1/2/3